MSGSRPTVHHVPTRLGPLPVRVSGDGPPVLAIHGLLVDGRLWTATADAMAGRARLVMPDLPLGAHRTPVPDRRQLTPVGIAGALVDLADGLELERPVLLGNDTGGALSQIAASANPDRFGGLVLAGVDAFEHFPPPLLRPLVRGARSRLLVAAVVRGLTIPALLADPGPLNILTARGFGRDYVRDLVTPALADSRIREDLRAFATEVKPGPLLAAVPGLAAFRGRSAVVWGRRDRIFPPRDAVRLADLLGTDVRWLDDSLTFVPIDRPDAVADAVQDVLHRVSRSMSD